ncbi:hypothetical protein MKX01_040552 [Papaver californicum]|nr:hypothetical protein MKX01_040552 [Papaver californicum]
MAALALKQELDRYLAKKYEEKILDTQFEQLEKIQEADNAGFVAEMLQLFIDEIEKQILDNIDPRKIRERVDSYVHHLKGSSIGLIFFSLLYISMFSILRYQRALMKIVDEFYRVKDVFQKIIELEEKIYELSSAPRQY